MSSVPLSIDSELNAPSQALSGLAPNTATIIKSGQSVNLGGILAPYEGSSTNGGFGGALSRYIQAATGPVENFVLSGKAPTTQSLIPLLILGGAALLVFKIVKR